MPFTAPEYGPPRRLQQLTYPAAGEIAATDGGVNGLRTPRRLRGFDSVAGNSGQ